MADAAGAVTIEELAAEYLNAATFTASDLSVFGGKVAGNRLGDFVKGWQLPRADMPWCIWEWVNRITFERGTVPGDIQLLDRGRVFGTAGDLSLRRDGESFLWHFVGETQVVPPEEFPGHGFWKTNGGVTLRRTEGTVLLWGEYSSEKKRWVEDRVARAQLAYPGVGSAQRIRIRYWSFGHGGQTSLIWWRGLEG